MAVNTVEFCSATTPNTFLFTMSPFSSLSAVIFDIPREVLSFVWIYPIFLFSKDELVRFPVIATAVSLFWSSYFPFKVTPVFAQSLLYTSWLSVITIPVFSIFFFPSSKIELLLEEWITPLFIVSPVELVAWFVIP